MLHQRIFIPPNPSSRAASPMEVVQLKSPFTILHRPYHQEGTLFVFVDGSCRGNGTPFARAGLGIFFGPGSPYNVSDRIDGAQTNQRAEILAASAAIHEVNLLVYEGILDCRDLSTLVVVSDSRYVVGAMTEWVEKWQRNGWRNVKGQEVANMNDLQDLNNMIGMAAMDVKFWLVPRTHNVDADILATAATRT